MKTGLTYTAHNTALPHLLAQAMGSGSLPVLATPAMIALMENAAMNAVQPHLPQGATTVGCAITTTHLRPTLQGKAFSATATLTAIQGRRLNFTIEAKDHTGNIIGSGTHTRYIIDTERFMAKAASQHNNNQ